MLNHVTDALGLALALGHRAVAGVVGDDYDSPGEPGHVARAGAARLAYRHTAPTAATNVDQGAAMTDHALPAERLHFAWDNSLEPVLRIAAGDSVTFETWDASGHVVDRTWTSEDAARRQRKPGVGHALTGPVAVEGARPGQMLVVEVLDVKAPEWGYTSFSPGRGLLPDDFPSAYIRIWDLEDGQSARGLEGVRVPLAPFCGVMGVALAEPGVHSTIPPRRVGGNMDVRQLTAGSRLYLPIEVDGALFSVGDAHGAQGDGEVCITLLSTASRSVATASAALEVGGGSSIATRIARMPSATAGRMSFGSELPIMTHASGAQPASPMAASKKARCGLRKPTSSEVTTASTR
jgi:acetamidase/formamidase